MDGAAAAEMVRVSGQRGVPVIVMDEQVVVGFDRPKLDQVIQRRSRPHVGAAVANAADMAAKGRCQATTGAYVGRVSPDGAAARAGLTVGDVITRLASTPVEGATQLQGMVARLVQGQRVPLEFVRGSETRTTTLVL